jgi:uncharacterized membrane protein
VTHATARRSLEYSVFEIVLLLALIAIAGSLRARVRDLETKVGTQQATLDSLLRAQSATIGTAKPGLASTQQPAESSRSAAASPSPEPATAPTKSAGANAAGTNDVPPSASAASVTAGPSLEERLGTRWAVWLGGAALALGGILMVRYSIERGIFGPGTRLTIAALFSIALVAAGEWLRRRDRLDGIGPISAPHIPSMVTAAGTIAGFGTIYAAHALYGFIGPAAAFVLLGAAALATMFAAALHGPALAGLGLAASFVTPMLVSSASPSPWSLVLFIAVVAAAAYWLARARRWLWLAAAAVTGAGTWGILMLPGAREIGTDWSMAIFVHTIVQLGLAAVFMAFEPHAGVRDDEARIDWIGSAALLALTMLACAVLAVTRFEATGWLVFALLAMLILGATAYRVPAVSTAFVMAGLIALAVAAFWPGLKAIPESRHLWPAFADYVRVPEILQSYLTFVALATLVISAGATWRLWNGRKLSEGPSSFTALAAVATPLSALVVTYLRVTQFDTSYAFAGIAVTLAALLYLVADRFDNVPADEKSDLTRFAIAVYAAGCSAAMALAFTFALSRGYLTVAFAVAAATTALFAVIDKIASLRYVVAALGFIVLARLAWDPHIMGNSGAVGRLPILNWLLLGYGAPAAAFLGAGYILKRERDDLASRICDALGVVFTFLLAFFQVRHLLNGGDVLAPTTGHVEQGLMATLSLGLGYAMVRADLTRANIVFRIASLVFGVVAVVQAAVMLGVLENPYFTNDRIAGRAIASSLLLGYLLPGGVAILLARASRGVRPKWFVTVVAILAVVLLFLYVTLETRHIFQGDRIGLLRSTGAAEIWSYSAVWLVLGLAFLAYGLVRGAIEARIASALLIVLATLKVFLFDFAGLTGFWRAFSFMGLGLVLMGIGLVYQKWIFAKSAAPPELDKAE